jgi:hypothetical protein
VAEWSLEGKVIGLTSDQGSNIKKCFQDYQEKSGAYWIPCTAHKMQGCINKAWDSTDIIVKITKKCSSISNFFNNNSVARDVLNKLWQSRLKAVRAAGTYPLNASPGAHASPLVTDAEASPTTDAEAPPPTIDAEVLPPTIDAEVLPSTIDAEVPPPTTDVEVPPPTTDAEVPPPASNVEVPPPSTTDTRVLSPSGTIGGKSEYMEEEVSFKTANVTRWNSKLDMVARVLDVIAVLEPTAEELLKLKCTKEEMTKYKDLKNNLLSEDEVHVLHDIVRLLRPAARFTHWTGGSGYSTISQVYALAQNIIGPSDIYTTGPAQKLHEVLDSFIKSAWPMNNIPDVMLLAMYFNPGCSKLIIWDLENAHQAAEHAAEQAAKHVTEDADQDSDQAQAQLPLQIPVENGRSIPRPTNRLRAETLVYRAIIQMHADKDFARNGTKADTTTNNNSRNHHINSAISMKFWKVDADCAIMAYRALWSDEAIEPAWFDDPVAFWKSKENLPNFSSMASLARMFLTIQATSSEAERLFSKAGLIYSVRRSRLSDDNFRNVIFFNSLEKTLCEAHVSI